jgi:P27 family predicted phage terminase small subunit
MAGKRPSLSIVPAPSTPKPPRSLGEAGKYLWNDIQAETAIEDPASMELLFQACSAADRAARLKTIIDADGELIESRTGAVKAHPLIAGEMQARALVVRFLSKLGLTVEPLQPIGRPAGRRGVGWRPKPHVPS